MTSYRRAWVLCCILAAQTCMASDVQSSGDGRSGTFKLLEGSATIVRGSESLPALSGHALKVGDKVVTSPNSAAAITFKDGTVVTVGSSASAELTGYTFNPNSHNGSLLLNLLQGSLRMVTGLIGKTNPELIKITTPTSVVGVRGTDFIVEALP